MENDEKIITKDEALKLDRFSLGCYSLFVIWAICNKCWEFLGLYILTWILFILFPIPKPIVEVIANILCVVFSFYALKLSYKRQKKDIDSFLKYQKKWDIAGAVISLIFISYLILLGHKFI